MLKICINDLHLGKHCWEGETGREYNPAIAESRFWAALEDLLDRSSCLRPEKVLFVVGNDFFSVDKMFGTTTAGIPQDESAQWQESFVHGQKLMIQAMERLRQVAPVHVLVVSGNHRSSEHSSLKLILRCQLESSNCRCLMKGTRNTLFRGVTLVANQTRLLLLTLLLSILRLHPVSAAGFTPTGSLHEARDLYTATLLPDGRVLAVAGNTYTNGHNLNSVELYDPGTGQWTTVSPLPFVTDVHTATLLQNGKVLVAGGSTISGPALKNAAIFDPKAGSWAVTDPMIRSRGAHTATLLFDGKVLVAGGSDNSTVLDSSEIYDPIKETWTSTGPLNVPRSAHNAVLLPNGKVLLVGGNGGSSGVVTNATEIYDPGTGNWTLSTPMSATRKRPAMVLLQSGKVLVAGGFPAAGGALSSSELFDPATAKWAPTGSLITGRFWPSATLLTNGLVLAAGGVSGPVTSTAELYDPATETWIPTGAMASPREFHTATLLREGKVLVAGGRTDNDLLSSAEIYTPDAVTASMLTQALVLPNGAFSFGFTNTPGARFMTYSTTDLSILFSNWTALGYATEVAPGQFQFMDIQATNRARTFYGVRSP